MYKSYAKFFCSVLVGLACLLPLPKEAAAGMISKEKEIAMGRETGQSLEAMYGLSLDPVLQEKVERVGKRLVAVCKRKDIEYSFKVLNSNEINALACPGGFIYVYKGLLDYMPSETELAGVLGHEITHVTEKHTVHAIEKQLLGNVLLIGAAVASGSGDAMGAVGVLQNAMMSGFSRTDERGADKGGLTLVVDAGYNPYSVLITMLKLDDYSKLNGETSNYGVFSSHPEPEERAARLQKQLDKLNIHPDVNIVDDDHAYVSEDNWRFDINQSVGATKAKYRAYMLAGSLWTVRKKGFINPNHFVVFDNGKTADIYYDDIQLYTIYIHDTKAGLTPGAYAAQCVEKLRVWADMVNKKSNKK